MINVKTMLNRVVFLKYFILMLLFTCINMTSVNAQQEDISGDMSLSGTYDKLYQKAETYNEYKVFKISTINGLWKSVEDSLNYYKSTIVTSEEEIDSLNKQISGLDERIIDLETTLEETRNVADSISVLGLLIPKTTYNIILWAIILGLGILIFIGYGYYKWSNKRYNIAHREYQKLVSDFERYKKSAQEKKIRLGRELQTERNKVVDLESRLRGIDGNL